MAEIGKYEMVTADGLTTLILKPGVRLTDVAAPVSLADELVTFEKAEYSFPNWDRDPAKVKHLTIHHSAGNRSSQNIRWWHRYHTEYKSWSRAGYHYGIAALDPGGDIGLYEINPITTHSWHDARNFDTVGLSFAGDLRAPYDVKPNEVQLDYFGQLMGWLLPQLPNLESIVGHFRWGKTACPGDLHIWYTDLIDAAAEYDQGDKVAQLISLDKVSNVTRAMSFAMAVRPGVPPLSAYDEHDGMSLPE